MTSFLDGLHRCKKASRKIALLSSDQKNIILEHLAMELEHAIPSLLSENQKDMEALGDSPVADRLLLTPERILAIASDIRNVVLLPDSVGEILPCASPLSSFFLQKVRVPFGVVAMIYESRPNVTIDAFALAFKSGNAVVLKGGKEAYYSNKAFVTCIHLVLEKFSLSDAVFFLENPSREETISLMKAKGLVDVLIPRGGKGLIQAVVENATVPVIETGASVVHTFVDESANFSSAISIILNEKTRRVSVCNALDTLLIHSSIYETFFPQIVEALQQKNVRIHNADIEPVDFSREWLDYDITIKKVSSLDEALEHIHQYSLGHSESIITEDLQNAERFLNEVDAACVYHNASTGFSDGGQFGLGAEIGISTQKLHVRGPFALEGLTTYKWKIRGHGEIRN